MSKSDTNKNGRQVPVAVVGMACLFPKAQDLKEYWRLIRWSEDAVREVPETHWPVDDYFDADPKSPDRVYCRRGAFLEPVDFDPTEYGIPPAAIEATDTAQLLGMVTAKAALEDAGYGADREFDRSRTSVILGVTGTLELVIPLGARLGHPRWLRALRDAGVAEDVAADVMQRISDSYVPWQENSFPGLLGNVVAGRIANRLDLKGTNCVVDAACASSLSALHLATLELASGKSDMVVAGGVDTLNDIFMFTCFSKTQALSLSGDARPFSADADGTVIGEGVGILILKRLEDAERDGDRIYAVIKGIGTSSDGKSQSIYAPRAEGQADALRNAYQAAGVTPESIELIEAHGTGTRVGDLVEFEALKSVYGESPRAEKPGAWCGIGSVKSQIGHTKAAAGAASLIKTVLALYHKVLPATVKVDQPHPKMGIDKTPFYINTETRPWITRGDQPRRAAVSSFGFGGSNFHTVLEEYQTGLAGEVCWDGTVDIVAMSAGDLPGLRSELEDWCGFVAGNPSSYEFAVKADSSRNNFSTGDKYHLVLVASRDADLVSLFDSARNQLQRESGENDWNLPNVYFGGPREAGKVAFLFPGQASQYVGMGRDLVCAFPEAMNVLAGAEAEGDEEFSLYESIFPKPVFDENERVRHQEQLTRTEIAQPAIGAISLAMYKVLSRFGVKADCFGGHSYGELVALCASGRISEGTLARLSRLRGRLMAAGDGDRGAMAAVQAPLEEIDQLIAGEKLDVVLANRNGPAQGVISGSSDAVEKAMFACTQKGWKVRRLQVSGAFHSKLMADAQREFSKAIAAERFAPGENDVFANSTAEVYPVDSAEAGKVLASQLGDPVRFVEEITSLYNRGVRVFVEVGPKAVLSGLVKSILGDRDFTAIAMDGSSGRRSGIADLAKTLAQLAAAGCAVDLTRWEKLKPARRKANMNIPLLGANYRSERKGKPPVVRKQAVQETSDGNSKLTRDNTDSVQAQQVPGRQVAEPAASVSEPGNQNQLTGMYQVIQEGLRAMQSLQEQTTAAHQKFLEGQEHAHRTFQMVMESQQQLLAKMSGVSVAVPQVTIQAQFSPPTPVTPAPVAYTPAPSAPVPSPAPVSAEVVEETASPEVDSGGLEKALLEVVSELTGYPEEMVELNMDMEADLGIDSIKRVEILAAVQAKMPELSNVDSSYMGSLRTLQDIVEHMGGGSVSAGTQAAASADTSAGSPVDSLAFEKALIEVVADLTGYPVEMLELDMDMEADLGIDSIKRVEILAAVQAKVPELGSVDSSYMGSLRTLRDITEHMGVGENTPIAVSATSVSTGESATGKNEFEKVLLEVVSELTGYPAEMLQADMDMEADLGIDSIKRVEILAAVQARIPGAGSVDSSHMGSLRTLGDIVSYMAGSDDSPVEKSRESQSPEVRAVAVEPKPEVNLQRQVLIAKELTPADDRPICIAPGHEVWIVDDGTGLAESLVKRFVAQGIAARVVGDEVPVDGEACAPVGGLIHLFPRVVEKGSGDSENTADQLKGAFALTKELGSDLRKAAGEGGAVFVTISRLDGKFGLGGEGDYDPLHGGLAGLTKTVAHEWPEVHSRALDVDRKWQDSEALADRVVLEIGADGPIEVGLTESARYGLELEPIPAGKGKIPLAAGDVVLVSGGARGVTAEATLALAKEVKPTLVLLGRSPEPEAEPQWASNLQTDAEFKKAILVNVFGNKKKPSPSELEAVFRKLKANREILSNIAAMTEAGAKVIYRSVDICDRTAVAAVVSEIRKKHGPIRGLIHGAGVIEDRFILDKDISLFEKVFDTKVEGLNSLLAAIGKEGLSVMVLFSSVTGRFGRQGQVDYAMANEVLNKIAQTEARSRTNCRVVSINWGPWAGGMVDASLAKEFERLGVDLIPLDAGSQAMLDELREPNRSIVEVIIGGAFPEATVPKPQVGSERKAKSVSHSANYSVVFQRTIDVENHPFLKSHVIGGNPVLPVAMIMEWLGHGALHNNPGLLLRGLDDIRVLKGVILDDGPVDLQVVAGDIIRKDGEFEVEVELRSVDASGKTISHTRAKAILAAALESSPLFDMDDSLKSRKYPRGVSGAYDYVLFHGQDFRGITAIEGWSEKGMVVSAKAAAAPEKMMTEPLRSSWIGDPLAVDVALQVGILWSFEEMGAVSLPSSGAKYRQYVSAFPAEGTTCVLRVTESRSRRLIADVTLLDKSGNVVASLEGFKWTVDKSLAAAFGHDKSGTNR